MEIHFLRPLWFLALIPLLILLIISIKNKEQENPWQKICDAHLLKFLLIEKGQKQSLIKTILIFLPLLFIIIALAGPAWQKIEVSAYKTFDPYVIVLDMSDDMFQSDLSPSRFKRAKFKLKALFNAQHDVQFAMIVFTREPFVVSPLTEDANTISQLLDALSQDIMPVAGRRLDLALANAQQLIEQAGFDKGNVLVLTASNPTKEAIDEALKLKENNIITSVIPVIKPPFDKEAFLELTNAGGGELLTFTDNNQDIEGFLNTSKNQFEKQASSNFLVWKDEGRWFLLVALLLFLPVFRRGFRIK